MDGLQQEVFRLFDNGRPQDIIHFEVEKPARPSSFGIPSATSAGTHGKEPQPTAISRPERYLLLVFDNVYTPFDGLVRSRDAAKIFLASGTTPADRIAVVTTAGDVAVEFTDDRKKLEEAFARLQMSLRGDNPLHSCPPISDYDAYQFATFRAPEELDRMMTQSGTQGCSFRKRIQGEAFLHRAEDFYRVQSDNSLRLLKTMVGRLASAPGERLLILISPGFIAFQPTESLDEIIDRALRAGVAISAIDPQGVVPEPLGSAVAQAADWDLLYELADSTGGQFFRSNNDIGRGFHQVAAAPEVSYLISFSPQNLKLDGKFHRLKVVLANPKGLSLATRHGYFAPTKELTASEEANKEIDDTVLAQTDVREIPADVRTAFYRTEGGKAKLAVFIRLDAKALPFHFADGKNADDLTLVTAIFDRNGNQVDGHRKTVRLRLSEPSLANFRRDGLEIRDDFEVAPGSYFVREVVRDSEGGKLSALNVTVDIHF